MKLKNIILVLGFTLFSFSNSVFADVQLESGSVWNYGVSDGENTYYYDRGTYCGIITGVNVNTFEKKVIAVDSHPSFTVDNGVIIYYNCYQGNLYRKNVDDPSVGSIYISSFSWDWGFFEKNNRMYYTVSSSRTSVRIRNLLTLQDTNLGELRKWSYSSDYKWIVYTKYFDGYNVYKRNIENLSSLGTEIKIVNSPCGTVGCGTAQNEKISDNGEFVSYSDQSNSGVFTLYNLNTNLITTVTGESIGGSSYYIPNNKNYIVYKKSSDSKLYRRNFTGEEVQLSDKSVNSYVITPDGNSVIFTSNVGFYNIYKVSLLDGSEQVLTQVEDYCGVGVACIKDFNLFTTGEYVLFRIGVNSNLYLSQKVITLTQFVNSILGSEIYNKSINSQVTSKTINNNTILGGKVVSGLQERDPDIVTVKSDNTNSWLIKVKNFLYFIK